MSYVVEQKIGNGIYLYEVEAYWDSKKGQSRQKRRYLGVKDPKTGLPKTPRKGVMPKAALNFGELWLLRKLADRIGLRQILEKAFEDETSKILDLACYDALETKGFHLLFGRQYLVGVQDQIIQQDQRAGANHGDRASKNGAKTHRHQQA